MWIEVFKAGIHTDANGDTREWTIADLDLIVEKYNKQPAEGRHDAPVVIGHPVDNSPAYGWVESLKREGNVLMANIVQLDEEFEKLIREGRYKKVSIALYPDLLLRHVGFLGAIPPAVKGLKEASFSELAFCYFDNADYEENTATNEILEEKIENKTKAFVYKQKWSVFMDINQIFQELINWLRETFNDEVANQTAAEIEILKQKYLKTQPQETPNELQTNGTAETANKEYSELKKKIELLEKANWELKFNEYFNSQLGRLVPAQKELVKKTFEALRNDRKFEFSEGDKKLELSGEELLKKLIESFPKQVEFSEFATKEQFENELEKQNKIIDEYNQRR